MSSLWTGPRRPEQREGAGRTAMLYILFSIMFIFAFLTFGMKALYLLICGLVLYYVTVIFGKN